jgi:hypothetical protein
VKTSDALFNHPCLLIITVLSHYTLFGSGSAGLGNSDSCVVQMSPLLRKGMDEKIVTRLDRLLANICEVCPVCIHARKKQHGIAFQLVRSVEERICPFCRAYEKVHGRKSHEAY